MLKSGQTWFGIIVCKDADGELMAPTVGPVGTLYVNGSANAALVTVGGSNPYSWSVILPALSAGDCLDLYMTATIDTHPTANVVGKGIVDTIYPSDIPTMVTVFPVGALTVTYIVQDPLTNPVEGVEGWISTDNPAQPAPPAAFIPPTHIVWKGDSDALGVLMDVNGNKPTLDAGVYYIWLQRAGYTPPSFPVTILVSP